LRGLLSELLTSERDKAIEMLDAQVARLQAVEDFAALDESARQQVMACSIAAREAILSARFVTGIRDRLQRYTTQDYPAQLALAARLAAPDPPRVNSPGASMPPAAVSYTPASKLRPQCSLPYIATESELDAWLNALRAAALAELNAGNRISL
jgi:hypothetical protein